MKHTGTGFTTTLTAGELATCVERQLDSLFPDGTEARGTFRPYVDTALERLEHCFSSIHMKDYTDGIQTRFSHLHTDQYAAFLYSVSHAAYRAGGDPAVASKVYALNKALHAIDVFYEVELPNIFLFQHPVGTVLGRAQYADYLFVAQRCTVGSNIDHRYPTLGEGVILCSGSALIGACAVGSNCWLSAGAQVMDTDLPSGTVTFGQSPNLVIKPTRRDAARDIFGARARASAAGVGAGQETR